MNAMQKKVLPIMLVPLFTLICHHGASAYYDPGVQRWINRDPIALKGGRNLYRFANNSPAQRVDFFGLLTDGDVCEQARAEGLDNGDAGGLICSGGGKKIPCVWRPGQTQITNPKAQDASIKCIWSHENSHKSEGDCPCDGSLSRLRLRDPKKEPESECRAYDAHVNCLIRAIFYDDVCAGDVECAAQLQKELDSVSSTRRIYCGGALPK
jgi:hypothetical protein